MNKPFDINQSNSRGANRAPGSLLSKLPPLPKRDPNFSVNQIQPDREKIPPCVKCAGCGARLDPTDPIHQRFCACRKCAENYGRIMLAMEEKENLRQKFILGRMFGGQI